MAKRQIRKPVATVNAVDTLRSMDLKQARSQYSDDIWKLIQEKEALEPYLDYPEARDEYDSLSKRITEYSGRMRAIDKTLAG